MYKYNLEPLLNNVPFSRQGFHEMEIRFLSFYNNACPLFLQGSNFFFFFFESSGFFSCTIACLSDVSLCIFFLMSNR